MKKGFGISNSAIILKINIAKLSGGCLINKLIFNFLPLLLLYLMKCESIRIDIRLIDKLYVR